MADSKDGTVTPEHEFTCQSDRDISVETPVLVCGAMSVQSTERQCAPSLKPVKPASAEHARRSGGHKATEAFFLDHRERQGALSASRQGYFPVSEFLGGKQAKTRISERPPEDGKRPSLPPPDGDSHSMILARAAFIRTTNFLNHLHRRLPDNLKAEFMERISMIPGPPRNLPKEDVIQRFEQFGRLLGYYGPVLWFMPPLISLEDLRDAGVLNPLWWSNEPNFIKGIRTLAPYEPDKHGVLGEPGFWALALPGIMPSTGNRTYLEQENLMADVARNVGLEVEGGHIHHRERIRAYIGSVADVSVFCAMANHAQESLSGEVVVLRTSTAVRTYQPPVGKNGGGMPPAFVPSLQDRCHVSVAVFPDKPMQLCDYGDSAKGVTMGLAPFFVPFVY